LHNIPQFWNFRHLLGDMIPIFAQYSNNFTHLVLFVHNIPSILEFLLGTCLITFPQFWSFRLVAAQFRSFHWVLDNIPTISEFPPGSISIFAQYSPISEFPPPAW
jgi:hypothetical protein